MKPSWFKLTCSAIAISAALSAPTEADADPITLAIASTAVAVGNAAAAGVAFTFLGLSGFGAVLASVAVRAALGFALMALTDQPSSKVNRGYSVNQLGPALAHQVVYGETRVGGAIFYQTVTGGSNEYLHRCVAVAGHEIDSYSTIYLNDEACTIDGSGNVTSPAKYNGYVRINEHLGADGQTADSDLVSEVTEWTTAHRARGVAYLYVRYYNDGSAGAQAAFPNGVPTITALIKGKKVFDPRDGSTAWSDNTALCLRDYLTSSYGLDESGTEINDTLGNEAADVCDEVVGSQPRYTCNGSFLLDAAPEDIIRSLTSSMAGTFWFLSGQWAYRAAKFVAPVYSFDEDDLRSNIQIATRHSRRDNFNVVQGTYRGAETTYQEEDYPEVSDPAYVTEDNNIRSVRQFPLLFTDNSAECQRIANIVLKRNREQITVTAGFGLRAMNVKIGDTIQLSNVSLGWTNKLFEVVDWRFGLTDDMDLVTNMVLREISASVFA